MLPTLDQAVQDEWRQLQSRKGEKGIVKLKHAFRNKIVKRDASYALDASNIKSFDARDIITMTRTGKKGKREEGITWSAVERLWHYNTDKIHEAIAKGHLWKELDSDGEEYWYERKKTRSVEDTTQQAAQFTTSRQVKDFAELQAQIGDAASKNSGWLSVALNLDRGQGCASSSGGRDDDDDSDEGRGKLLVVLQDAWDALTQLTADAGTLSGRIIRDPCESKRNNDMAMESMELLKKLGPPSATMLAMLGAKPHTLVPTKARAVLQEVSGLFISLEANRQHLIENTNQFSKKQKTKLLSALQA